MMRCVWCVYGVCMVCVWCVYAVGMVCIYVMLYILLFETLLYNINLALWYTWYIHVSANMVEIHVSAMYTVTAYMIFI